MKKKKSKEKKSKRTNKRNWPLIISIFAFIVSFGQLIFTYPVVLKQFEKVELKAVEFDIEKPIDDNYVRTSFMIINTGANTAKNVELHLRVLKNDKILFVPEVFNLAKDDTKDGIARNLIFKCEDIVPGEKVRFFIHSDFSEYLETNSLDTLYFNKPVTRPELSYGPYITILKHSLGKVLFERPTDLTLYELK
ncbi:hypothetical protein H8K90_03390 [Winogradskyella echinorum]|uniref:DUF4352 domain-containing protein n=1 Tax=Winogradskyella echinorum TaxID=538189 RepID=A0ABR6XY50_9FLAO|nr:hypothetical protein [Winogradskyella echinorum]MBC3845413.1 hypothetical protein [Winogradskyella echinorum]MBC5749761.1 hypothetical protein [Winogradskyella echinorum]